MAPGIHLNQGVGPRVLIQIKMFTSGIHPNQGVGRGFSLQIKDLASGIHTNQGLDTLVFIQNQGIGRRRHQTSARHFTLHEWFSTWTTRP